VTGETHAWSASGKDKGRVTTNRRTLSNLWRKGQQLIFWDGWQGCVATDRTAFDVAIAPLWGPFE